MSVSLSRRTAAVPLYQGDDEERLGDLREEAVRLRARADALKKAARPPALATEGDPAAEAELDAQAAEDAYNDFADEAADRGVVVRLQALKWERWEQLVEAHPPRDGNDVDRGTGWNAATLPREAVPEMLVEPQMTDGERSDFLADLSFANWDILRFEVWGLNTQRAADPKERLGSGTTRT